MWLEVSSLWNLLLVEEENKKNLNITHLERLVSHLALKL